MSQAHFDTIVLTALLTRARKGDRAAHDELLRACQDRLLRLAARMLRKHPSVQRWVDTGDVFQNASLRLLRALESTSVADTREFFNLAAAIIRRELLDLARHYHGPEGIGANHASQAPQSGGGPIPEGAQADPDAAALELWAKLHETVDELPPEEREVFGLTFYHGWSQSQIAELFDINVRTVGRRWKAALQAIHDALGGQLP